METGVRPGPRNAAAAIDERTAPRLAGAIAVAWEGEAKPGGEPEPATYAETRDSRTARGVAAVVGVLAVAAALAIATRATDSGERGAHPGRARGWFRGAPALAAPTSGPADGRNPGRGEQDMRSLVTAGAALAIGAAAQAQVGEPVQWRVEDGGNGHWFVAVGQAGLTFDAARAVAKSSGGDLPMPKSKDALEFLFERIASRAELWWFAGGVPRHGPWLGLIQDPTDPTYSEPSGGWKWLDGSDLAYSAWASDPCTVQPADCICGTSSCGLNWAGFYTGGVGPKSTGSGWGAFARDMNGAVGAVIIEFSADCNSNGIVDFGEIRAGQLPDQNANNVPDGCECAAHPELDACCPGDLYRNGVVNGADLGILLAEWGEITPTTTADLNRDGAVDGSDLGILLSNWGACPG